MQWRDSQPEVLVVGGGVIGLMSALRLAESGRSVVLIERGAVAREASWAGGGILAPLCPWHASEPLWQLAEQSLADYPSLAAELQVHTGIDPEWQQCGMLVLDQGEWAAGQQWCAEKGLAAELQRPKPEFEGLPSRPHGLLLPWVSQIRNPRLCTALRERLTQMGVRVHEQVGDAALRTEGRRAQVLVDGEVLEAGAVVAAMGAWTGRWLAHSGWAPEIAPIAGQMLLLKAEPGLLKTVVWQNGRYLIPRLDGHILVGSTLEQQGFSKRTSAAAATELRAFAINVLPELAACPVVGHWCGLRPGSPDGLPTIQKHPLLDNLYVNAGHFRYGLTMAPASARRLAALINAAR